jgi:4-hydroxy-tetrahydrodipicolinate reductase
MALSSNKQGPIAIGLCGAAGRMGREIMGEVVMHKDMFIAKTYESPDHSLVGRGVGQCIIQPDTTEDFLEGCNVLVDFSAPGSGVLTHLERAAGRKVAAIVGSTGLDETARDKMEVLAKKIPLLYSANMSLGVNLLIALAQRTQELVGGGFDVDILEMHHRAKRDLPSGTALMIERHLKVVDPEVRVNHHSIRAGDVVGEHTVLFTGVGERLELTHRATSRKAFTTGIIAAIRYVCGKPPGMYDMRKVLGI